MGKLSERRKHTVSKGWRYREFVLAVTARSFPETKYFYDSRGGAGRNDAYQTGEQPLNQEPIAPDLFVVRKVLHHDSFLRCLIP
jgi:hypothetical protein